MENDTLLLVVGTAVVVVYQVFVSYLVNRCQFFLPSQRRNQYLLIWFVPMLGALICHAVIRSHGPSAPTGDSLVRHYEEVDEYGWPKSARRYSNPRIDTPTDGDGDE